MKKTLFFLFFCLPFVTYAQSHWMDVAVIDQLEVSVDTLSIKEKDGLRHALVKTVYTTQESRSFYVDKIRNVYKNQDKKLEKKMRKWADFSYNISHQLYDCANKKYKIVEITDYTSDGKKIIRTKPNGNWMNIGIDTMGDHNWFFVCDYAIL